MSENKRVCIIGAGTAGLCAVKNALEHGMDPVVFEQTAVIGGTWVYTEQTNADEYGHEIVSSLYEGLRTNLPKEVMGYPDYLYPSDTDESFIGASDVLKFLQAYTVHYKLQPYIRLSHSVIRVRPRDEGWEVMVKDLPNNRIDTFTFDFVLVCNGHYTTPLYPDVKGKKIYQGLQTHSHYFRKAEAFKDQTVLLIGAGPSGIDIAYHLHKEAKSILLSHHLKKPPVTDFMQNVEQKPDVEYLTKTGATFVDGTNADFTCIIYCTGYHYTFPFLSVDSGVYVVDNHVQPLYKHCISIKNPTMAFIGLPYRVCPTQLCDMQLRFALKYYSGQKTLPRREEMMDDLNKDREARRARGLKEREAHLLGKEQFKYFEDLAETAGIANIKPVVRKLLSECHELRVLFELQTYRQLRFRILDDENYERRC